MGQSLGVRIGGYCRAQDATDQGGARVGIRWGLDGGHLGFQGRDASDPGHLKGVPCGFGHILNARALARYFWIPVNSCNSSLQSHPGTPANFFFSDLLGEPSPFCTSCLSLLMDQQLWPPN